MKMKILHRLLLAGGLTAIVFVAGIWRFTLHGPAWPQKSSGVGVYGPVIFAFKYRLNADSIEGKVVLNPSVGGKWTVDGTLLMFWPEDALSAGDDYDVTFLAGIRSDKGRTLWHDVSVKIKVRSPVVAYLGGLSQGAELWLGAADGSGSYQITETGGKVVEFAVSRSGETLAYGVKNDLGGTDLWLMDHISGRTWKLLECGNANCGELSWNPDGNSLVYTRIDPTGEIDLREVRLDGSDQSLGLSGRLPVWSPKGDYLAFYDVSLGRIGIRSVETGSIWWLDESPMSDFSWSSDGQQVVFIGVVDNDLSPFSAIYTADVTTKLVRPLFLQRYESDEYGLPRWSPDDSELLAAYRALDGAFSKQLFILNPDGAIVDTVTRDLLYTHGGYSWAPDGKGVLFQRLELGGSDHQPEVLVWQRDGGQLILLARDAAMPRWVP